MSISRHREARPPRFVTDDPKIVGRAINILGHKISKYWALSVVSNLTAPPVRGGTGTPIDTTFARSSWILSVGSPSNAVGGSKQNVSTSAQDRGLARMATYRFSQGAIFITNNVPYIARLDRGWSEQQSAGFVDRALNRAYRDAVKAFR